MPKAKAATRKRKAQPSAAKEANWMRMAERKAKEATRKRNAEAKTKEVTRKRKAQPAAQLADAQRKAARRVDNKADKMSRVL